MRRAALCAVALILSLPTLIYSQAEGVGVGGEEGEREKGKEAAGNFEFLFSESSPNPCGSRKCPKGSECVPVVNELLQLPIAHCQMEEKGGDGSCSSSLAAVSVVSCRSEVEWRRAGRSKCAAMGGAQRIVGVQVHHPCHRRDVSSPPIFIQATLTCCHSQNPPTNKVKPPPTSTEAPPTSTKAPPASTEAPPTSTEAPPTSTEAPPTTGSYPTDPVTGYEQVEEVEEEEIEEEEEGHSSGTSRAVGGMFIAMATGIAVLLMAVLVIVKVVRWSRRRRSPYKPQVQSVTAYVNPCSEGSMWEEGKCEGGGGGGVMGVKWDSSYVVSNHGSLTDTN